MYILTLKTSAYTGNFEREICAYMTGQIGECGVGNEKAYLAEEEVPKLVERMEEIICQKPDENGCHRPVCCIGNSLEIYFDEKPSYDDMIILLHRAVMYNRDIKILYNKFEEEIITRDLIPYNIQIGGK